jgi:hypothetical protein
MKENLLLRYFTVAFLSALCLLFLATFGKSAILRTYIEIGVGNCKKIPVLCMAPEKAVVKCNANEKYFRELIVYSSPKIKMGVPAGFTVVEEKIRKVFYKKKKRLDSGSLIYLLYQEPDFFINLFPQLKKSGIKGDYEFISRTMNAKIADIKTLTDAFFVIMKGIFIPDLGDQRRIKMEQFKIGEKKVFINYTLANPGNYFDCNVIDENYGFFKVYIKDKEGRMNLEEALTIISTLEKAK